MDDYLPTVYTDFRAAHPDIAGQLDSVAVTADSAGPLTERERRLVKLGIAIGAKSEGAVRSSTRKLLAGGLDIEGIRHAALLAITTAGFPTAIAALGWMDETVTEATRPEDEGSSWDS